MSDPTTENKTAKTVNSGIKLGTDTAVNVVEALIIADAPFLGVPIIKQLFGVFLGWISGYIIRAIQTGATFAIIDAQVDSEVSDKAKAAQAVIGAEKTGDANVLRLAIQRYADLHSALVHSDGSAAIK